MEAREVDGLRFDAEVDQHSCGVLGLQEPHEAGAVDGRGSGVVERVKVQVESLPSLMREVPAVVIDFSVEP